MWPSTSRHLRGYGADWDKLRKRVLERDSYLCQCKHCKAEGRTTVATEVDHIVPKAKGGNDSLLNLQAINRNCHKIKSIEEKGGKPRIEIGIDGYPIT